MVPMVATQHAPSRKRLPMSARIFAAAAMLGYGYSAYLDHGIAWLGILALVSVVVIILVKRHQRQQDAQ